MREFVSRTIFSIFLNNRVKVRMSQLIKTLLIKDTFIPQTVSLLI